MMNDFIFDLQRFQDTIKANQSSIVTFSNGTTLSLDASTNNDLVVDVSGNYALITLSSASDFFQVNGKKYGLTSLGTSQTNGQGVTFSLGSSSAVVGGIDSGDIFYVADDEEFSMTSVGLFAGTNNSADKVFLGASTSSVSLNNNSVPADQESNWYKIVPVSGNKLSIDSISAFDATGYKGVIVSNTNPSSFVKYASLNSGANNFISSLDADSSLSDIALSSNLMSQAGSKGIMIDDAFAGNATTFPYIEIGQTTVKVTEAINDFKISGGDGSNLVSIEKEARQVSLIGGSLVTSNVLQTISAGNYKITGYNDTDSSNNDGIQILSDTLGNVTLGDIDVGESFSLQASNGSAVNYTMTALGLIKAEDTVRPLVYNNSVLTAGSWTAEQITAASPYDSDYYLSANGAVIPISGTGNESNPTLIAYNNSALATLSYDSTDYFVLKSDEEITDINPGAWDGISLGENTKLSLYSVFAGEGDIKPLTIQRGENSSFGISEFENSDLQYVTLGGSETSLDNNSIIGIYLNNGSINAKGQNVTLGRADDISMSVNGGYASAIINSNENGVTLTKNLEDNSEAAYVDVGRGQNIALLKSSSVTIDKTGKTKLTTDFILDSASSNSISAQQGSNGSVTFVYGKSSGFAVTGLTNGENFNLTISDNLIYYDVQNNKLISYSDNASVVNRKIWYDTEKGYKYTVNSGTEYSISSSFFKDIIASEGTLTISTVYSSSESPFSMAAGDARPIFGAVGKDKQISVEADYGTLYMTSDGYKLNRTANDTSRTINDAISLSSILITDSLPVAFEGNFANTTIEVNDNDSIDTKFRSQVENDNFNVSLANVTIGTTDTDTIDVVHAAGAKSVSLIAGTLFTNESEQTIQVNNSVNTKTYSIAFDSLSTINDGIFIGIDGNTDDRIIGEIDFGESFYLDGERYQRNLIGFSKVEDTTGTIYSPTLFSGTYDNTAEPVAVTIGSFMSAPASTVIAAVNENSTYYGANKNIFEIGGTHTFSAIVADDTLNPSVRYASLKPGSNNTYSLYTMESYGEWSDLDIISVMGGETTINKALLENNDAIIVAHGSQAVFKVDSVTGKTFNVSGKTTDAPTVGGANALTLLNGSITATLANSEAQTVKIGTSSRSSLIANESSIKVAYDKESKLGTIIGSGGTNKSKFSFASVNSNEYSVGITSGNGVDFIVNPSGNVTVTGFGDNSADAFYFGNATYAVKEVGLIKNDSVGGYLWNNESSHSLSGSSIEMASLQNSDYWLNIQTVSSETATVSPNFTLPVIFVDSLYSDTYGTLEEVDKNNKSYSLTKSEDDGASLDAVNIESGVNIVYFDNAFLKDTITTPYATFQALTAASGNSTYQVSINSDTELMSLEGVSIASLTSGAMIADSNIAVHVYVGNNDSTSIKSSKENITLRAVNNNNPAAIMMTAGASFAADGYTYTLGNLGLSKQGNKYLPQGDNTGYTVAENTGGATIAIATITGNEYWAGIIAPDSEGVLSIKSSIGDENLIVVDQVSGPNAQYAQISKDTSTNIYKVETVSGAATVEWASTNTFMISDSSVSFASDFHDKPIAGVNSSVKFYFSDTDYAPLVSDGKNGATITNAREIHQSAGIIFASDTNQTIETADNFTLRYGGGDGIKVVVGEDNKTSLSSLNADDTFYVNGNQYSMSSDSRLRNEDNTKILKETIKGSLAVANIGDPDELNWSNKWSRIVPITDAVLTVNSSELSLSGGESGLVIGTGDIIYGTLTRTTSGDDGYSLTYDSVTATKNASLTAINVLNNDALVTLSTTFKNVPIWAGTGTTRTTLRAIPLATATDFTVDNHDPLGVAVAGAPTLSLGAGTIKVATTDQTVNAGSYNIHGLSTPSSVKTADDIILVTYDGSSEVSVGELNTGERFGIGNYTFEVTEVGLIRTSTSPKKLYDGDGFNYNGGEKGVFRVDLDNFNTNIIGLSAGVLNLSKQYSNAVVVDDVDSPTKLLANFSLVSGGFSLSGGDYQSQITSVYLGTNSTPLSTDFETTITTDDIIKTFTINGDAYRANSALTIHSGDSVNTSYLINGNVSLNSSEYSSVKTSKSEVSVEAGNINVVAAGTSAITLSGLGKGDQFSIKDTDDDVTDYTYTSVGLFKDSKIYKESIASVTATDLDNSSNWRDIITISSAGVLDITSTLRSDNNEWIILNSALDKISGTLKSATAGGYSIISTNWGSDTISVKDTTVYFTDAFDGKIIKGDSSDALFKIMDSNIAFSVTDSADAATVNNATRISMESGTIALPKAGQTVVTATATKYSVAVSSSSLGASDDGITVIMGESGASLGSLNITKDNEDRFTINGKSFVMLPNGRISRSDNKYWISKAIADSGTAAIADLMSDDSAYWGEFIEISEGMLTINSDMNSALIIDESDSESIYGKLLKDSVGYTLDGSDADTKVTATLQGIAVERMTQPVTFTERYLEIPITTGDTTFEATEATDSFTVNYTRNTLGTNATGVDLKKGSWSLSDTNQTLTADGQTIKIGGTSTTINISYDGTNAVTVAGLDSSGEVAYVNDVTYSIGGGDGISLNIADDNNTVTTTVKGISDGDNFAVGSDTFIKNSNGFIKNSGSDYYLWTAGDASLTGTGGVALETLNNKDNWLAVATIDNRIVINNESSAVVFIDSTDSLSNIYGALSTVGGYNLSNTYGSIEANAKPTLISVEDVSAALNSYYTKITISAAGASFVANTVTGNTFTVNGVNAALGNVTDVSLLSGTLADLTSVTTVRTKAGSVAAQGDAEINVGFDATNSVITFSELDDDESFGFKGNTYTYKNVGIVKDSNKLYVNDSLNGTVKSTAFTDSNFRAMVASDGSTIILQNKADDVVFVNSADTAVSAVYATQDYSSKNYTFDTLTSSVGIINASALDSGHSVTTNFDTQVLTPSTGKFTINEKTYNAVTALTIDTTTEPSLSSSLNTGTVSLTKNDNALAMTGVTDSISVDSGDGISVTAESEAYTLSGLNKNDVFTIGGYSYTMKSANMIVRQTSGGNEELYTSTITGGSLEQESIEESSNWAAYVQLEKNGNLNLTTSMGGGVVVSNDFSEMYANLTVNGDSFDLDDLSGAETSDITAINLTATDSTLTTDFDATVKTATGSNTYTINGNAYTALNSSLQVETTATTSTITKGVITLENSTVTTTDGNTISGSLSAVDVGNMKFTPAVGNEFTVNDDSYARKAIGLTKNDSYLWTREGDTTFSLPAADSSWSNMMTLTATGVLNLKSVEVSTGSTVILDHDVTERIANLTYSENSYALTSVNNNSISSIQLGDASTALTLSANFESFITTGNGTYQINDAIYKGSGLTVKTTADDSGLYSGTVSLEANDYVADSDNGYNVTGLSGVIIAQAIDGTFTTIGDLNSGETFKIDDTYYKVLDNQVFVQTDASGKPSKLYDSLISGNSLNYADVIDDDNFVDFIALKDGVLDLTQLYGAAGWSAIVVTDADNPITRVAKVSYSDDDGGTYSLEATSGEGLASLTSIKLGSTVKNFTTALDKTVNTTATGTTYKINDKTFAAQTALSIAVAENSAVLTNGTITLAQDVEVTTRRTSNSTQVDEVIKATSGTITVAVDDTADTVTIGGLNAAETFTVDGNKYTMTNIGLLDETETLLNNSVASTASVLTTDLSGSNWQTIHTITNGELILTSSTPAISSTSGILVVDTDEYTSAVKYGTLTKPSGDNYALSQDSSDSKLTSISLTGTRATFGTKANNVDITAGGATFSVTSEDTFTVNAVSTSEPPSITGATGINLSTGTIQAPSDIPITANGRTITATNGDMTITNTSGTVTIAELETGDTFTVDGVNYRMTDAGLLDTTNQQICAADKTSYTIGDDFTRIIAVDDDANLSLSSETKNALVYDSVSEPTTHLATLTVESGKKTLTGENNAATNIQSIDVSARDNLTVDFVTKINSPSGIVTVNSQTYSGTSELVIDSDGTTSTLYSGTITLNGTYTSATDSKGNSLTRNSGTFNATASGGSFETLNNLGNTESFTYGDKTYTQGTLGLVIPAEIKICTDITPNTTITLADLNTATWNDFLAPINNVLDISALSDTTMVYNDGAAPTTHLATFTMSRGQKTLAGESGASTAIQTVIIAAGDTLTVDFKTQINSPSGTVTVNDQTYSGTTALVIDSVVDSDSGSATSKLYSGTINLNRTYITATDSKDNTLTRSSGDFTATAEDGKFTMIEGLDTTESFTYNDVTYVQSALGLRNGSLIRVDLTDGTIDLADLYNSWANILAPRNGVLDISEVEDDTIIFDSATNPATRLANLVVDNGTKTLTNYEGNAAAITTVKIDAGDILTIDFAATINSPIGAVTVNNKDYVGTTALVIASDGTTSTLTQGTITLTDLNDTVTTTSGTVVTYTVDGGNGMTVAVDSSGITFNDLTNGDNFTVGEAAYKVTAVGPINSAGALWKGDDYTSGITLDALNDAANWTTMLAVTNDALTINAETLADGGDVLIVDNVSEPTKLYGELTKADGTYSLTQSDSNNATLTSITADGVKVELAAEYAGVDLVANDSAFSNTALTDETAGFTLDATGDTPTLSDNVKSLTLTAGTIAAAVDQTVTVGANVITPTTITGAMVIGTTTISGIATGDAFTLNAKEYKMLNTGLFNDTDNKLVTEGFESGTLTIADIGETRLLAITNGTLDLSQVAKGNTIIVDTAESPTVRYGTINRTDRIYTLNKESEGITSITLPDANSTLTTDVAATITAPEGSKTFYVNEKKYKARKSALTIASDGTTSTLTQGEISLTTENDTVTTTSGSVITYTTGGNGIRVAVDTSGITFKNLTNGDNFTVGEASYKVSAVGPINSAGALWKGDDYTSGITLDALNDAANWTTMLAVTNDALSINAETLADGGDVLIVDNVSEPTKLYGELTKADGTYSLTQSDSNNATLTSIPADGVKVELAAEYAGVDLVANDSAFSNTALTDETAGFTLDATGDTPTLSDNVKSLTLTAGTIAAAVDQTVTVGANVITPTAINGAMVIGTTTISGIVEGDAFTLNDKEYKMLNTGLFNDTDNKLVTEGFESGTLTIADIGETRLLEITGGLLDLSQVAKGNTIIVDTAESPTVRYGTINRTDRIYTLNKESEGITSITLPDANSTLTTDVAATINAPEGSKTFYVNEKKYKARKSALTIASDGTTSTLTQGEISLTTENDTVTTTSGSVITYTTGGNGIRVAVDTSGITFKNLTNGDNFTVGEAAYKVSAVGPINSAGALWKGDDYTSGITLDALNDAANWTTMLAVTNDALTINAETLADGGDVLIVDNVSEPTKLYGELTKADGSYSLTQSDSNNATLTSITASGVKVELAAEYAGVNLVANDSAFSNTALTDETAGFTLDATGDTPTLSDNVKSLTLTAGTIAAAVDQTVTVGANVITPTTITGAMVIGLTTISGIATGDAFTLNDKEYKMLNTGLFDDTDNKLVTAGYADGVLTFADIGETQLFALGTNGTLDLSLVADGNTIIVDKLESPETVYGTLTKAENIYTLNKQTDGINFIAMPDETSTLTTDVAAEITTPSGSNTFTINGNSYTAADSALVIESDGTTSTLTDGKISLAEENATVTTTGGNTITYTAADGDGMTIEVEPVEDADDDTTDDSVDDTVDDAADDSAENEDAAEDDATDDTADDTEDDTVDDTDDDTQDDINKTVKETIKFDGLTTGDTFTINGDAYKVSAVGPVNSSSELWTGGTYTGGITLAEIDSSDSWTAMLAARNDTLTITADTLADGGEFIAVDNINDPTKIYGDLTRADDTYNLTQPDNNNATLSAINTTGIKIELAPEYAGVNLKANSSTFSDVTISDANKSFTLDGTGDTPTLSDNVQSLTLTDGTITAAVNQTVTVGTSVITPTTINGVMIIDLTTISGIVEGDAFTLGTKSYKMLDTGLFNDTDNKLVTTGYDSGTLTIASIDETQLIAVSSSGTLDLNQAAAGNSIVVDKVESPTKIYGALNKNGNTYTLNEQGTAGGIKSITMPDTTSTLTTDITATINAATSSNTYTVNRKKYIASSSALVIASDGSTSTLTDGTITLADQSDTVTTTSGTLITYTTDGDGMTVTARASGSVSLDGLTLGDTFNVGDDSYRVTQLGFLNNAGYIWTSTADYRNGVSVADTGSDGINNADNWTRAVACNNGNLSIQADTLADGISAVVIDSATDATKTLGTLKRSGDTYTLTKAADEEKMSSLSLTDTTLKLQKEFADVPITADGATFTVTADNAYTVDATGDTVSISEEATAIEISAGTIAATVNQTVTATSDSGATKVISSGNGDFNIGGETFTVANNVDGITFGMTNGIPDTVSGFEKDATVIIDGDTYTSPADNSTLKYTETDGWYFDAYIPTGNRYHITIDILGNITVDSGVKFSDVVSSGRTLPDDKTIKLAFDVNNYALNVTSQYPDAINIYDAAGSPLVENLGKVSAITFDDAGVMVENLSDVPGAVFTLDLGQNLETEAATITANANDCEVGVGTGGNSLSIDKAATVTAPENIALTLGNAEYKINGVDFTTSGTAQASLTSAGVKVDLAISDAITYDDTNFNGKGSATANLDDAGGISLTSGASVDGAIGKMLNITGTVTLDANTIDAATATDVTAKAHGYAVANDDVTVTGDNDGYKLNIANGIISGLENIGNVDGVTIGGLSNGTVKTDKVGTFTVADRTFLALGDSAVVYGIENGKLATADDVDSVITGDFDDGLKVNGGKLQVTGDAISLTADTEDNRKLSGFGNNSSLTTADGIVKIEPTGAGKFSFDGHTFETDDATIAFNLRNSHVTGIDSLENGTLIISQDETTFNVNDETIALSGVSTPITLGIADSEIDSVYGMNGGITGLDDATVFGLSTATINGKYFNISGDDVDAFVVDGNISTLRGLDDGATVGSAPEISVRTTDNGTFTFRDDVYNISDTLDGVVKFTTDINSYVTDLDEFEGSISGNLEGLNLNGKAFSSSSDKVTVANDGEDVIALYGLSSGDTITGSLSKAEYVMPQGTLQVNDQNFILKGDEDGVSVSGDGSVILGLDRYASLTVAQGGDFSVNSDTFKNAPDGTTFIAGRDHVYIADPNNKPIHEKTDVDDIIENLIGKPEPGTVSLSGDSAASVIASGNLDSPMALILDNTTGKTQNADFSNSEYSKRVTLIGGDQNVKFNDEGKNGAYVAPTATGKKNIELGNGGDVAVNDSPFAKVSVKTGTGADTIVNRNGAETTVDVENNGDTTIVPTSGRVTLQNYDENNNAKIRNFDYSDMLGAIKSNDVKFGDGVMTLGDAVVVFDANASETGGTWANLVDYAGNEQRVGFTHTNGGVLNASTSSDDLVLKGNYAESSSDTQKTGPSTLISGSGDDTILAGEGDYVRAGGGDNQIYITDSNLRGIEGATIYLSDGGRTTVHNFSEGYETGDAIIVNDVSAVDFTYGDNGLVMRSGNSQMTFDGLEPADDMVTYSDNAAAPYQIKITNGKDEYNAAIAQDGYDIGISDNNEANVFYGNASGGSGLNFSEYTGAVEVNLNNGTGNLNGSAAQIYNINKVQAGEGNATLTGKDGANNTLIAGTGNTNINSGTGNDLMVGNTSDEKDGFTTFNFKAGDGRDTITGFDFMSDANDYTADIISLPAENIVTNVIMDGNDILMYINESANDYLRLQDAVGNNFKINDRIAKVETVGNFDNLADFYVVSQKNATMKVGADIGDAQVWLDDRTTGEHGVIYKGDIKYLDAREATGNSTLVGNDLDNVIYGGKGSNSIWGGFGANNDTLVGGSGHNVFFFGLANGSDTITSINAGDVVYLANDVGQIASTTVTSGSTKIELTDGSALEIQGNAANVEYHLADGNKFTADHAAGKWNEK